MPKLTLKELKQKRNELAILCMKLQDESYEDYENEDLRQDLEDAEEEYEYVCNLIEREEGIEK